MPGWTLSLDLPVTHGPALGQLLDDLDRKVADVGGRVYFAKDSRMRPELVPVMYPRLDEWRAVCATADPDGVMQSDLSRRLQLPRCSCLLDSPAPAQGLADELGGQDGQNAGDQQRHPHSSIKREEQEVDGDAIAVLHDEVDRPQRQDDPADELRAEPLRFRRVPWKSSRSTTPPKAEDICGSTALLAHG